MAARGELSSLTRCFPWESIVSQIKICSWPITASVFRRLWLEIGHVQFLPNSLAPKLTKTSQNYKTRFHDMHRNSHISIHFPFVPIYIWLLDAGIFLQLFATLCLLPEAGVPSIVVCPICVCVCFCFLFCFFVCFLKIPHSSRGSPDPDLIPLGAWKRCLACFLACVEAPRPQSSSTQAVRKLCLTYLTLSYCIVNVIRHLNMLEY